MAQLGERRLSASTAVVTVSIILAGATLNACANRPPSTVDDVCTIFEERRGWYRDAKASESRWGTPLHVQMAIIQQESAYRFNARPQRKKLLKVIPWKRPSSAYGFAQVKDSTWRWYQDKTGNRRASRSDFADAVDFVGWYTNTTQRTLGVSKWDAANQYLAYHEGHGGYSRRSFDRKAWLGPVAHKVARNAQRYATQLRQCRDDLDKRRGWFLSAAD